MCYIRGGRTGDVKKHNDNSIIAANSVLLKDTEGSGVYAGSPARKVK